MLNQSMDLAELIGLALYERLSKLDVGFVQTTEDSLNTAGRNLNC